MGATLDSTLTLKRERRLRVWVFENRVLRRMFVPKGVK
jgi:hypothetical protein